MYAPVCTRPDIAYVTGMLDKYLSNPEVDHWKAAKRVLRYLQRTKGYILTYQRSNKLEIIGYTDSNFTRCQNRMKFTSGYIYLLARDVVSCKSAKHSLIAFSTMTAEFIVCYKPSNHGIWLWNFVSGLLIVDGVDRSLILFCDNKSPVLDSNNNRSSTKSKYIDIKFLVVKERV